MSQILQELKRRNVFWVAGGFGAGRYCNRMPMLPLLPIQTYSSNKLNRDSNDSLARDLIVRPFFDVNDGQWRYMPCTRRPG